MSTAEASDTGILDETLSVEEVAKALNITHCGLLLLIKRGMIPGSPTGRPTANGPAYRCPGDVLDRITYNETFIPEDGLLPPRRGPLSPPGKPKWQGFRP